MMARKRSIASLVTRLVRRLHDWAEAGWAGPAAGTWAFAQSAIVPGPSDTLLVPLGLADPRRAIPLSLWSMAGSVLGSTVAFAIGRFAFASVGHPLLLWLGVTQPWLDHIRVLFATKGATLVALGSLPMLSSKATGIAAGAFGFPFWQFVLISFLVRGLRFVLLGIALRFAGEHVLAWWERRQARRASP
jgi:membrane protein YqaA with SNARE-associated domain